MPTYEILHNPRCSKSRQTLELLTEKGVEPTITLYLDNAPTKKRLKEIAAMLDVEPIEMMRTKEAAFKEQQLTKQSSHEELFSAMAKEPKLIERPIVIKDNKTAVLGRPPENVLKLMK